MESLMKADIFFVVTSVSVVILAVLAAVVLIYIIRILRDIDSFIENVKSKFKKWSKK